MSKLTKEQAIAMRKIVKDKLPQLSDYEVMEAPHLLDAWRPNREYQMGCRLQYEGKAYKVNQTHLSSDLWFPPDVPALYTEISVDEWPEWKQPTGAQDAYNEGDKVTYEGKHYISTINGNVWSPAAYPDGWEEQP